ncbi:hypothetical protein MXB_522, partial [Myxobolus squamalis]
KSLSMWYMKRLMDVTSKLKVGKTDIKLRKQKIILKDSQTKLFSIFGTIYCGAHGKPDCQFLNGSFQEFRGRFSLKSGSMM